MTKAESFAKLATVQKFCQNRKYPSLLSGSNTLFDLKRHSACPSVISGLTVQDFAKKRQSHDSKTEKTRLRQTEDGQKRNKAQREKERGD